MEFNHLTKTELDRVLAPTSPHSFKHNISLWCAAMQLPTRSEPSSSMAEDLPSMVEATEQLRDLHLDLGDLLSQVERGTLPNNAALVKIAIILGAISVQVRTMAAMLGIPLEDVQDVLVGSLLSEQSVDQQPKLAANAVNTMLYGVRKPRHPYENIQDE